MCSCVIKLFCLLVSLVKVLGHVENDDGSITFASKIIYATKDGIWVDDKVELSTQRCASVEGVEALLFSKNIRGSRIVKCQLDNGSGKSTVNEDLLAKHNLQNISPSLNCSVMNNSVGFEVSWQLGISLGATLNQQDFENIVIVVICRDKDDMELRNDVLYIFNQTAVESLSTTSVQLIPPTINPLITTGSPTVSSESVQKIPSTSGVRSKDKAPQFGWYLPIVAISFGSILWLVILMMSFWKEYIRPRLIMLCVCSGDLKKTYDNDDDVTISYN